MDGWRKEGKKRGRKPNVVLEDEVGMCPPPHKTGLRDLPAYVKSLRYREFSMGLPWQFFTFQLQSQALDSFFPFSLSWLLQQPRNARIYSGASWVLSGLGGNTRPAEEELSSLVGRIAIFPPEVTGSPQKSMVRSSCVCVCRVKKYLVGKCVFLWLLWGPALFSLCIL